MARDLTLVAEPDGYTYALGEPSESLTDRAKARFVAQFLSIYNADTGRGTVFMEALVNGRVKTNADIVTIVSTAAAQVRTLERTLSQDVVLESAELLDFTFVDRTTVRVTVRLNTTAGSVVNDIVVAA